MAEQPTTTLPALSQPITAESVQQLATRLEQGRNVAVVELQKIKDIPFDINDPEVGKPERDLYNDKLVKAKAVYEKMYQIRKPFTDKLDEIRSAILAYENEINYQSKNMNEYNRARAVIEAYDQKVLDAAKHAEKVAEFNKRVATYKADLRAAVQRALLGLMTSQEKTLRQGMINWEAALTLDDIEAKAEGLKKVQLKLNKDKYDACFHTNFDMNTQLLSQQDTEKYIQSLKSEFTYEHYNEQYIKMAAPIKSEYIGKIPDIKAKLQQIKDDKDAAEQRQKELQQQSQQVVREVEQKSVQKLNDIENEKELAGMEAEFQRQGSTQDLQAGPSKKIASFSDDKSWLSPFLAAIGHVACHPKFPGITKKSGEYIDAIDWWLKQFAQYCSDKTVGGLTFEEKAKTAIRKK